MFYITLYHTQLHISRSIIMCERKKQASFVIIIAEEKKKREIVFSEITHGNIWCL